MKFTLPALLLLIVISPLLGLSQKCDFDCYKITHLDNTRSKTCYSFELDSSRDLTYFRTTYTINTSAQSKSPLWVITFNLYKKEDSIVVSFLNKYTDMSGSMKFKYSSDYFPVIFNDRKKGNSDENCYDLTVNDKENYNILFSIYNSKRPFVILNKFQPPGNDFVTYELSTLKEMKDSLDENIISKHINNSIQYWLSKEKRNDINNNSEENYQFTLARALNFLNIEDTAQARQMLNSALMIKPGDMFAMNQLDNINRKPAKKRATIIPEHSSAIIPSSDAPVENNYESITSTGVSFLIAGDSLMINKSYEAAIMSYEKALNAYSEASSLKPLEQTSRTQLRYINQEIREARYRIEEKRQLDSINRQNKLISQYLEFIDNADAAKEQQKYEKAIDFYKQALEILQDPILVNANYRQYKVSEIVQYIKICQYQLKRTKRESNL